MFSDPLPALAERVIAACLSKRLRLATAESCTGGLIAGCLTSVPGASDVLQHGIVSYANEAKINFLGVNPRQLEEFGAVSEPVARAMAEGAIAGGGADIAVSVTGIAGPGGGSEEKPVGLVHMAAARRERETLHERHLFQGDRERVREQAIAAALQLILKAV